MRPLSRLCAHEFGSSQGLEGSDTVVSICYAFRPLNFFSIVTRFSSWVVSRRPQHCLRFNIHEAVSRINIALFILKFRVHTLAVSFHPLHKFSHSHHLNTLITYTPVGGINVWQMHFLIIKFVNIRQPREMRVRENDS